MPKCTRLKDAKEHTYVKMPMSTMLKDANEHTSHDTCFAPSVDLKLSRLKHLHEQVDQNHQVPAPTTTVHSRSFKRGVSFRAQASGLDLSKAAKKNQTERC
ncbi:hypothetical protein L6452_22175 [Arctium lappa]|uniref:Uncharacterized protein n=1 Tax=Arctium lappa TaxID=4217 RepID=A0ACB9B0R3_ARCLA|nr:hypothetical protein L6452_22175 [Arctium lappa]